MFTHRLILTLVLIILSVLIPAYSQAQQPVSVASPDGSVSVRLTIQEKLEPNPAGERLYYSVLFHGKQVILDSPMGLEFRNMAPLAANLKILNTDRKSIREEYQPVIDKNSNVLNHCNELLVELQEKGEYGRKLNIIFRAYNDGVAFRYELPDQPHIENFNLTSERTHFRFADNHQIWAADYGGFVSHQEMPFNAILLDDIRPGQVIGLPMLVKIADDAWAAVTEANLEDWAGMYLTGGTLPHDVSTMLSPRHDDPGVLVKGTMPHHSPWRVVMLGTVPGRLVESNIIINLNEPCAIEDPSWIRPGKSAWDRWWSGDYAPDAKFEVGINTETSKYFTDLAAEMGWEFVLVDWWWYGDPMDPEADITTHDPKLDIHEVIRDANSKGVDVLIWLRWNHTARQMEEAFPLYEKWGVRGVKIDFMQRDDQEMVNWYHDVVKLAAKYHLTVDFHGAYKPTGIRRTWPNLLTREGVLGNEHNKWSADVTPEHTTTLPFTRMLAGPMDYTPGGFRQRHQRNFVIRDSAPYVMGTRTRELAYMVVYESPLQVICDSPYAYRNQPGTEFLKAVPTVWDETRVLHGMVGDDIVIARRNGDTWYIGAITDESARTLKLSTDFLGGGEWTLQEWTDPADADDYPNRLETTERTLRTGEKLVISMAAEGGYAAILKETK
jgi:alpha-glucosidase